MSAKLSRATRRQVESSAGRLASAAARRMESQHEWYRDLTAEDRSWVGLVAHAGIAAFIAWLRTDERSRTSPGAPPPTPVTADIFATAPRELTRSVTLQQTLDLVRSVVDVVEDEVGQLAASGDEATLREAVLRYSREVAFSAAQIYAEAAEVRGAWDARLEALVVDSVLRGEADDSMRSRIVALGWGSVGQVTAVAGPAPATGSSATIEELRRETRRSGCEALATVQGRRLVLFIGGSARVGPVIDALAHHFGPGSIVIGPTVPHLYAAGRSARAAINGLAACPGWTEAPRVVSSDELLPERAINGDAPARGVLVQRLHDALIPHPNLLETATAYLEHGGSLEATARLLFVHPNTIRYRLRRITEITGYDLAHPRDAFAGRIALALGRIGRRPLPNWRDQLPGSAAPAGPTETGPVRQIGRDGRDMAG